MVGRVDIWLVSALLAPIVLIGSWVVAPIGWPAYDSVHQTISELAAGDSPRRVFETVVFVVTGLCHIVTASTLPGLPTAGRVVLGIGGVAVIFVAAYPLPTMAESSVGHTRSAVVHFTAMCLWPAFAVAATGAWIQTPRGAAFSLAVMVAMFAWFGAALRQESLLVGLSERFLAGANVLWPLFLVLQVRAAL